jgi:hypothetical protein
LTRRLGRVGCAAASSTRSPRAVFASLTRSSSTRTAKSSPSSDACALDALAPPRGLDRRSVERDRCRAETHLGRRSRERMTQEPQPGRCSAASGSHDSTSGPSGQTSRPQPGSPWRRRLGDERRPISRIGEERPEFANFPSIEELARIERRTSRTATAGAMAATGGNERSCRGRTSP